MSMLPARLNEVDIVPDARAPDRFRIVYQHIGTRVGVYSSARTLIPDFMRIFLGQPVEVKDPFDVLLQGTVEQLRKEGFVYG
jgi:hypothetical protein